VHRRGKEAPVMARRGDEIAARAGDGGRLRAAHADREQVIGTLKAAFVQGLLDKDEFDLRVGQTFASRTYADLAAVTADIPAGLGPAQPPEPTQQPHLRPGRVIRAATVLYAGVWAALILLPSGERSPASICAGLEHHLGLSWDFARDRGGNAGIAA
jgi:hypothetical protein